MAAPTYRCPFKVDATLDVGITCENVNCAAYDQTDEHCSIVMFIQQQLKINGRENPNNA